MRGIDLDKKYKHIKFWSYCTSTRTLITKPYLVEGYFNCSLRGLCRAFGVKDGDIDIVRAGTKNYEVHFKVCNGEKSIGFIKILHDWQIESRLLELREERLRKAN